MKNKILTGSLCTAGILLPQITFAEIQNDKVSPDRPNIIFILADDMGYGDLSCYGNQYVKTPNIDQLAETGTRFNQCYAGSGISSPSRCATVLSAAGYRTCLVNKWHLDGYDKGASPNHRGFDEFYGWTISTVHSNSPYYYPYYRFHGDSLIHIPENANGKHGIHNNDLSTNDAIAFIKRNKDNPFFLYLAFDAPHEPYNIDQTAWYEGQETWEPNTKRYASLITHMDAAIGRLLNELEQLNLRKNTLIIFASDNGAAIQAPIKILNCNAGFKGRKGMLYEGGIRVPFIVNQPGMVPIQTLDNLIYFPDMMPTLAALAKGTKHLPKQINGINILPLFYGKQVDTDNRLLYWEFPGKQRAARKGDWKCVTIHPNQPLELYNLKEDPEETNNLAKKYPRRVKEFDEEMQRMHIPTPNWPQPGEQF